MNRTKQSLLWGIVLGSLFGAGMWMGVSGGWEMLSTLSLPLLREERLDYLRWMLNPTWIGIGLSVGAIWGLFCGVLVNLGKEIRIIVTMFLALPILISAFFLFRNPSDGSFWLILLMTVPTFVGFALLQVYLKLNRPFYLVPTVLFAGILVGYIPWTLIGRDTVRVLHRTQTYAQKHSITNYQISVTQAESGGYRTKIHLEDGSILYCYAWPYETEFKECTPTPQ